MKNLMFKKIICIFTTLLFFMSHVSANSKTSLKIKLQNIIKKSQLRKNIGISIGYFSSGEERVLLNHQEQKKMIPASLTKIITAGAALEKIPKAHKFVTQLWASQSPQGSQLNGDLYLKGGGDPSFVSETMWRLVNQFLRSGVTKINGNIVVDDSRFDQVRFDPGREKSRVSRAYDAPIGAMSFNWNSVNLYIQPGDRVGQKALVFADPENSYINITNEIKTTSLNKSKNISIERKILSYGDNFKLKGQIALNSKEVVYYRAVSKPEFWSGENLKSFLSRRGIELSGLIKKGLVPEKAILLSEEEGSDISQIVRDMMKFSNNYVAEMLVKNIAAENGKQPATMGQGLDELKSFLFRSGLESKEFSLVNPSGLTRKNLFSTSSLHKVLLSIKHNFQIFPEFLHALPIAGVDGTLKKRLGSKAKAWIRAKTGRLNGVTGLGGFAGAPNGDLFSFIFLFNGSHSKLNEANQLFDQLALNMVLESRE